MLSYNEALTAYNEAYAPPRSAIWHKMPDNARALKGTSATNKAIHKTDTGVIYFRLYDTKVAEFHPPETDKTYKVIVRYVNTPTTNKFMADFRLHFGYHIDTNGNPVRVPYVGLSTSGSRYDNNRSAELIYDSNHNLITNRSWHPTLFVARSTAQDKQTRKYVRKAIEPVLTLMGMNLAQYKADADMSAGFVGFRAGQYMRNQPFAELRLQLRAIRRTWAMYTDSPEELQFLETAFMHEDVVDAMFSDAPNVIASIASHRFENDRDNHISWWKVERDPEVKAQMYAKYIEPITFEEFANNYANRILREMSLDVGTGRVALPLFQSTIPAKVYLSAGNINHSV